MAGEWHAMCESALSGLIPIREVVFCNTDFAYLPCHLHPPSQYSLRRRRLIRGSVTLRIRLHCYISSNKFLSHKGFTQLPHYTVEYFIKVFDQIVIKGVSSCNIGLVFFRAFLPSPAPGEMFDSQSEHLCRAK